MTTERIPTIWDQPLPRTPRQVRQRIRHTERVRTTARLLTLWRRPTDRRSGSDT